MLEAILAMTALAMVVTVVLSSFTQTVSISKNLNDRYFRIELARSLLEEYVVTYPALAAEGVASDKWGWRVTETVQEDQRSTSLPDDVQMIEVGISVFEISDPGLSSSLNQTVLRKLN